MRQIFTSQRLETVEGVAKLLREAGIEVHISNERSYRGKRGSQFRYTEPVPKGLQPAVWVRHPEDQPRARQILREAGLLETTRPGAGPAPLTFTSTQDDPPRRNSWAWRIRLILLGLIAVAAVFTVLRHRAPRPATPAPAPVTAPTTPAPAPADEAEEEDTVRVQVKPASGN
nr:pathogenicity-like protein [Pseudoxanthomonas sp.]